MNKSSSLGHKPEGKWKFDESVSDCFDDMLERSVPLYHKTLDLIADMASMHLRSGDTILDVGVSQGSAVLRILNRLEERGITNIDVIGIDNSKPMLEVARNKLPSSSQLIEHNLKDGIPMNCVMQRPRVILCLWTAQFIPLEYRERLFSEMRMSVDDGGCLFVAEKLKGQTWNHQKSLLRNYRNWKIAQGYCVKDIDAKAESLEGVLVSYNAPQIKNALMNEGWFPEEVIRFLGFASWYCLPKGSPAGGLTKMNWKVM
jgi:tRNA (cmo5U34)-methyltransferase